MGRLLILLLALSFYLAAFTPVAAREGQVLGIHILSPSELEMADQLLTPTDQERQEWSYVTVPLSWDDLEKHDEWQRFFDEAQKRKIVPLVRLVTKFDNGAWQVPNRKQITDQIAFLSKLKWPTEQRHLIVFNEVNHAPEWGGQIDPVEYAKVLSFTADWAHSENKNYVVLPAAMDLAASTGGSTLEAFTYLNKMHEAEPEVFTKVDVWNSHSYPNPGFSSSPERTEKNSLRGFKHELAFVKEKTGRDLQVFITETGWVANRVTTPWLEQYYLYALQHVWSAPEVLGVTPFVLRGDPGPFSGFAFLDRNNQPTSQYLAYQRALEKFRSLQ